MYLLENIIHMLFFNNIISQTLQIWPHLKIHISVVMELNDNVNKPLNCTTNSINRSIDLFVWLLWKSDCRAPRRLVPLLAWGSVYFGQLSRSARRSHLIKYWRASSTNEFNNEQEDSRLILSRPRRRNYNGGSRAFVARYNQ